MESVIPNSYQAEIIASNSLEEFLYRTIIEPQKKYFLPVFAGELGMVFWSVGVTGVAVTPLLPIILLVAASNAIYHTYVFNMLITVLEMLIKYLQQKLKG